MKYQHSISYASMPNLCINTLIHISLKKKMVWPWFLLKVLIKHFAQDDVKNQVEIKFYDNNGEEAKTKQDIQIWIYIIVRIVFKYINWI